MKSEFPAFPRLDPSIDAFMGNGFALKARGRICFEPARDDIGTSSGLEFGDHVFTQGVIPVQFSFSVFLPLSTAVCFFLGDGGGICPIPGAIPFNFPIDHPMVPFEATADLTDAEMRFQA